MLKPKKLKFKKYQKGSLKKKSRVFLFLEKSTENKFRLESLQQSRLTTKQLESARQLINKRIRRTGKLDLKVFSDLPVTKKPTEVRMGKGKGSIESWICKVTRGTTLFELIGASKQKIHSALTSGAKKLPIKTYISN